MAVRRTLKHKVSVAVKKPDVSKSDEFMIIQPPEKHVLASMNIEISTKELKRRLPKPVLPEPEIEL